MPSSIAVVGNLTANPDVRVTPSGNFLASFTVAENSGYRNAAGEFVENPTIFWPVTVWGEDQANHIVETLGKGDRVMVIGETRLSSWTDKDSGEPRSRIELQGREVGVSLRRASAIVRRRTRAEQPGSEAELAGAHAAQPEPAPF